jgi:hypothetical protein
MMHADLKVGATGRDWRGLKGIETLGRPKALRPYKKSERLARWGRD